MISIRRAKERGHTRIGWLDSRHTFSFGGYRDPEHMGFRSLRVINDDRVAPGAGFDTHAHRDMEIITVMLEGELAHRDSLGSVSVLHPGEVQVMSAGAGITHSEYNHSDAKPLRLLQIWILPREKKAASAYRERSFPEADRRGRLRLVASPDEAEGSLPIGQDARVYMGLLEAGQRTGHVLPAGRRAWLQVAKGTVALNGQSLGEGDGAAVSDEAYLEIEGLERSEVVLFDLA